jgi:hypothetical protein
MALNQTPTTSGLAINIYDGTRQLISPPTNVLFRIINGQQEKLYTKFKSIPGSVP